jgi:hypothetical protein
MKFVSAQDTWVRIVLWISNLVMVGGIIMLLLQLDPIGIVVLPILVASLALVLWIQFATYYRIDDDVLFIRSGPFHWTIPIASISEIAPTDDPTSGPALSMRRLRLDYAIDGRTDAVFISPENREGFLEALRVRKQSEASAVPPRA